MPMMKMKKAIDGVMVAEVHVESFGAGTLTRSSTRNDHTGTGEAYCALRVALALAQGLGG